MTHIDETLRKLAEKAVGQKKGSTTTSSNIDDINSRMLGDPNCEICHGIGFVSHDVPITHPNFGKMEKCSCRIREEAQGRHFQLQKISNLQGYTQMTFETFSVLGRYGLPKNQTDSLEFAYKQAHTFAEQLNGWLLLMGGFGTGKTHLAASIGNFALAHGVKTIFLTVPDLLDWLRYSYQSSNLSFEDRFEELRNVTLLILDDLGTQNATAWAEEKVFQIINHRYLNRLPTVITTNLELGDLDGRISSRLQDADHVTRVNINAPDYRAAKDEGRHSLLSSLEIYASKTFDTFHLRLNDQLNSEQRENLSTALRRARTYAENPKGWLVLIGESWSGKTHLAAAIGNYRLSLGFPPIFVVVPDLLDHLRGTFNPASNVSYDKLFEEVRSCPMLILDDLGTQNASTWAKEKLYQIINHRYNANLHTVVTAISLEDIDKRLVNRLLDGRISSVFEIYAPPYRVAPGVEKKPKPTRGKHVAQT